MLGLLLLTLSAMALMALPHRRSLAGRILPFRRPRGDAFESSPQYVLRERAARLPGSQKKGVDAEEDASVAIVMVLLAAVMAAAVVSWGLGSEPAFR